MCVSVPEIIIFSYVYELVFGIKVYKIENTFSSLK